ncbi:atlastin-2-like [Ornithodoros turicata]|uniref:atlastin-2-like n=1 Tax=Ornithodoros turicata TaxID=34597 RepID=UPI003138710D
MATYSTFAFNGTGQLDSGACPVVVRPNYNPDCFELRNENLERLLTDPDVADLPVVIFSVAGGFRLGKSFLLGFCIRYLEHLETSTYPSGWMDEDNIPLTGFSWKYGSEKETTGIQLWRKVFKIMTRQHGLMAVVLMDTEGAFDQTSTLGENVTIFSMSMLLSSIQVYNLSKQITQSDLEHLKIFAEYASMARSKEGQGNEVFQKLLFLIRDWQYPGEKSFGLQGGEALLRPWLERNPTLPREVSELRENIRSSFGEVRCFLMPRPGDAVENTSFDGRLRELSKDFKYHIEDLLSYLLSPETLVPKKISGTIIKCKELVCMFQTYFSVFDQKELPQPMSVFNATAFVHNKRIIDEIVKKYEATMEGIVKRSVHSESDTEIEMEHGKLMKECLAQFESEPKLGKVDAELREQLTKDLNARFDMCKRTRTMLKEYNKEIQHRVGKEREEIELAFEEKLKQAMEEERTRHMDEIAAMAGTHKLDIEKVKKAMEGQSIQSKLLEFLVGALKALPSVMQTWNKILENTKRITK